MRDRHPSPTHLTGWKYVKTTFRGSVASPIYVGITLLPMRRADAEPYSTNALNPQIRMPSATKAEVAGARFSRGNNDRGRMGSRPTSGEPRRPVSSSQPPPPPPRFLSNIMVALMEDARTDRSPWAIPFPAIKDMRRANRLKREYLERHEYPYCGFAHKYERLAKIGQGMFG